MNVLEIIEQLCDITRLQADIIEKQAEVIAQAEIADSLSSELSEKRKTVAKALSEINYNEV